MRCAILADDLTGALDAAAPFAGAGAAVVFAPGGADDARLLDAEVIALSSDSRDLSEADAVERTMRLAARAASAEVVFKKIDSALRGHPEAELLALERVLAAPRVLIAPAFPAQGRTTVGGEQRIRNLADGTLRTVDLRAVFGSRDPARLRLLALGMVRQGCGAVAACLQESRGRVLADAADDDDLLTLAEAARVAGLRLVCGTAGLAAALARGAAAGDGGQPKPRRIVRPALIVCGSRHAAAARQLAHLAALGVPVIRLDRELAPAIEAARRRLADRADAVVAYAPPVTDDSPDAILDRLARATVAALGSGRVRTLVILGGATGSAVCRALEMRAIRVGGQSAAGVPWGIAEGGVFDGGMMVTKSGGFGGERVLGELLRFRG